jgi:LacI family transcriptional regulator
VVVSVYGELNAHRSLIAGVYRHAVRQQLDWVFPLTESRLPDFQIRLDQIDPATVDGVIGIFMESTAVQRLQGGNVACVNVLSHLRAEGMPVVASDDEAIGREAARHLLAQNIRRWYYFGPYSTHGALDAHHVGMLRFSGLAAAAREAGLEEPLRLPIGMVLGAKHGEFDEAVRFLCEDPAGPLHQRCGLLLFNDALAPECLRLCQTHGIDIPRQLACVGVDNDPLFCIMLRPTLSSVPQNMEKIGQEAARQLERLFAGETSAQNPLLLPPLPLHIRQSSEPLHADDPMVTRALNVIRAHDGEHLTVDDLLKVLPASRRSLEQRFRQALGFTPYQVILNGRIERAKTLLASTGDTIETVALNSGFQNLTRFAVAFKQHTGMAPGIWRAAQAPTVDE